MSGMVTLQETNISLKKWHFEDHFPFPQVGYVNPLEGSFFGRPPTRYYVSSLGSVGTEEDMTINWPSPLPVVGKMNWQCP